MPCTSAIFPPVLARFTVPIAPATDLLVGSKTAATAPAGDVWSTALGFTSPLPALPTGHYQATVVFTVVAQ